MGFALVLLPMLLFSCGKELTPEEYSQFITDADNGFRNTQTVGDFELSALYEPSDYILSKEFRENDEAAMEKRKMELDEFSHFQFQIKMNQSGNILKYDETTYQNEATRISHFSFQAAPDFSVVSHTDTLRCKLVHYSRNYNLSPTIDLSLTFEKIDLTKDFRLIYTDSQFNIGIVKFLFKKEYLEETPELKI